MAPTIGDFFTAVPGVVHATKIPASVGEILIRNDSPYDQWVKFNFAPTAAPSPLTFAQYDLEVTPGREQIIPPPGFNGGLWIGCYNPGGKAASGTISSRANVYVRYYPQGQSAGAGAAYSALTGLDTTSQQRVISIPTEPHVSGTFTIYFPVYQDGDTSITIASGGWTPGNYVTVYTYGAILGILRARYAIGSLDIAEYNGSTLVVAHSVIIMDLRAEQSMTPLPLSGAIPTRFIPNAATTRLAYAIGLASSWPAPADISGLGLAVYGSVMGDIDLTGQTPPPAIGNGAGTPPGAIY